jgi:hypothetical protein
MLNMATYKVDAFLGRNSSDAFDVDHQPGVSAPFAGIYRCMACDREIATAYGHTLPPQAHHIHTDKQGAIRWRLIGWADHNPK